MYCIVHEFLDGLIICMLTLVKFIKDKTYSQNSEQIFRFNIWSGLS